MVCRLGLPALLGVLSLGPLTGCTTQFALDDGDRDGGSALPRDLPPPEEPVADAGSGSPSFGPGTISNEAAFAMMRDFKYRGAGFRRVNRTPFPSTVSPDKTIVLWVSEEGYDAYTEVSPDHAGSGAKIPVGTVLMREVYSGGTLDALTMMIKLADGAFPLGGDYWYLAASPDGQVRHDAESGAPVVGLMSSCGTCHLRRNQDDFLFGVPASHID